jgi:hypothetical protein
MNKFLLMLLIVGSILFGATIGQNMKEPERIHTLQGGDIEKSQTIDSLIHRIDSLEKVKK